MCAAGIGNDTSGAIMHTGQSLVGIYAGVGRSRVLVVGAEVRDTEFGLYDLLLVYLSSKNTTIT